VDTLDENREGILANIKEAGGRLKVRNALNPILWLCGLVCIPCLIALGWANNPHWLIPIVLCSVLGTAIFGFLFLLFYDRERLQSEDYMIRSRTLNLIEEKGSRKAIDAATVQAISQEEFLALPEPEKGVG
jgi:hypothetical protein